MRACLQKHYDVGRIFKSKIFAIFHHILDIDMQKDRYDLDRLFQKHQYSLVGLIQLILTENGHHFPDETERHEGQSIA